MERTYGCLGIGITLLLAASSADAQTCGTPGTGSGQPDFGAAMCGISATSVAAFNAGRTHFISKEEADEGLGPVFNGDSCVSCHAAGGVGGVTPASGPSLVRVGGASNATVTRFGKTTNGVFDPLVNLGGSLIQANGIGRFNNCSISYTGEAVPSSANVSTKRLTTPLFGLGLIERITQATLETIALAQPPAVRGHTAKIKNVAGQNAIGRFGWKAQVATVFDFSGDAYLNEMGITTAAFPRDSCPQGNCAALDACDPFPDSQGVEDSGEDVQGFADFMTFLAPPPQVLPLSGNAALGAAVFTTIQCNQCHTPSIVTGPTGPQGLTNRVIFPYSDFLLHDMGTLGDGIVQGNATATEMRTAPLWGARVRTKFLHDGRATNIKDAIKAHAGQGTTARNLFNLLPAAQQDQLVAFINTL